MTKNDYLFWYGVLMLMILVASGFLNYYALTWLLGRQPVWYVFLWVWMMFLSIVNNEAKKK